MPLGGFQPLDEKNYVARFGSLAKTHIQDPMQSVFDAPMIPKAPPQSLNFRARQIAHHIANFSTRLILDRAIKYAHHKRLQMLPFFRNSLSTGKGGLMELREVITDSTGKVIAKSAIRVVTLR